MTYNMKSPIAKNDAQGSYSYLSLFSGIGGLEHPDIPPVMFCERDRDCHAVLASRHLTSSVPIHSDVQTLLNPPPASFVVGGWPCQDISSAGNQLGLSGNRSGLFFDMLRVARASGAHTMIGENVPNLLTINGGRDFDLVKQAVRDHGFPNVSWRILNAREFGLPQDRSRLFIVASKTSAYAQALHSQIPDLPFTPDTLDVHGFYWTGGKRSICFSTGYVPALKVGGTDNKGRGTVAVFDGSTARKLTVGENLALQGFSDIGSSNFVPSTLLRMAGNAVAKPVGQFVVASIMEQRQPSGFRSGFSVRSPSGLIESGVEWSIDHKPSLRVSNLAAFLDERRHTPLSAQASAGLIVRSVRSGAVMPSELFDTLYKQTLDRGGKLHPSRGDSLAALASMQDDLISYRNRLENSEVGDSTHDR